MKKIILLSALFSILFSVVSAQSLDKLMAAPDRKAQGDVSGSVSTSSSSADSDLAKKVENQQNINNRNSEYSQKYSEGKLCKSNCYTITNTYSDKVLVKCLIGTRSGNEETIFKYNGVYGYTATGAGRFKSFEEAARFVCSQ